jgi:hypothetical protein
MALGQRDKSVPVGVRGPGGPPARFGRAGIRGHLGHFLHDLSIPQELCLAPVVLPITTPSPAGRDE